MDLQRLHDLMEFDPQRPVSKVVHNSEQMRLVLFCLEAGQTIPAHTSPSAVAFLTLSGRGQVLIGRERAQVEDGCLVVAPPQEPHGLVAQERLAVLAAIAPSP